MLRRMSTLTISRSRNKNIFHQTVFKSTAAVNQNVPVFKPWNQAVVESHGDYRQEAWLEDHIGGPLYAKQHQLPRLPVPDIQQTLDRFLPTALPLAKSQQEIDNLKAAVAAFPAQSATLQERLLKRSQDNPDSSWLQLWWNTLGYLQVRDPVIINVSYFFHFADDPTATSNIQRAAAMLTACGEFRKQVCSGNLPAETVGKKDRAKTLCSTAFKYMFHACRIPAAKQDSYKIYDPSIHHHAVIARKGHFFRIELCDPDTAEPYHVRTLEAAVQVCLEQAELLGDGPALGWCTSSTRDDWAKARTKLIQHGGSEMERALEVIESGAVLICMDDEKVVSRAECAEMLLHGGANTGGNRWFDKSIQLIVSENGKAGFLGEHSMMDGMPMVGLADHITNTTYAQCLTKTGSPGHSIATPVLSPSLLQTLNYTPLVEKAKRDFADLVTNNSLHVQSFHGYGSSFIKQAGYSPDAFVQVAMQLATYRLWGEQAGTYEATQVRPFLHGRTETTRSVSLESGAFVQRLGLRPALDEHNAFVRKEKLQLLQDAVAAHVKFIGQAAQAHGVDRHFFGLSMLVQDDEKTPDLYADPIFIRSKRWRVSTSHLTHPKFDGWGYGQVVPDGVGLAYSIHPRHCIFNITALKNTGWTDKLSQLLEESLLELRTLIEMETIPKSKL